MIITNYKLKISEDNTIIYDMLRKIEKKSTVDLRFYWGVNKLVFPIKTQSGKV